MIKQRAVGCRSNDSVQPTSTCNIDVLTERQENWSFPFCMRAIEKYFDQIDRDWIFCSFTFRGWTDFPHSNVL
jgi:hypothetical protein